MNSSTNNNPLRLISVTCYDPSMKEGHSMYKAIQFNLDFETDLMMVIGKLIAYIHVTENFIALKKDYSIGEDI